MQRQSLRVSLSVAMALMVLGTAVSLGTAVFITTRAQDRASLGERLGSLAGALALAIDPEEHSTLQGTEDMDGPLYAKYRRLLLSLRYRNPDVGYAYTLRKTTQGFIFVLDSGEGEGSFSPLGMAYEYDSPTLAEAQAFPDRVVVGGDFETDQWGTWLTAFAPVTRSDGTVEAWVGVDISAAQVLERERNLLILIVVISLGISVLGILAGLLISRSISAPLLSLADDMGRIRDLVLEGGRHPESRIAEVSVMVESLENMKNGLRSFKKYVPADVVGQIISLNKEATLGTEKRVLTILFSDLENFTGVSEHMASDLLNDVLGTYFATMTQELQRQHATVDKFIGDSVMAFWGAPHFRADHAILACRAALACQKALTAVEHRWKTQGIPPMRNRMGINTGDCIVGNVGFDTRLSFTALGDAVNLASRLESLNKFYGTAILLGEQTWDSIRDAGFRGRLVDRVAVKGKTQGIRLYELWGEGRLDAGLEELGDLYHHAVDLYFRGQFLPAATAFEHIIQRFPEDKPSKVILAKCRQHAEHPPSDWDGVTHLHDK